MSSIVLRSRNRETLKPHVLSHSCFCYKVEVDHQETTVPRSTTFHLYNISNQDSLKNITAYVKKSLDRVGESEF